MVLTPPSFHSFKFNWLMAASAKKFVELLNGMKQWNKWWSARRGHLLQSNPFIHSFHASIRLIHWFACSRRAAQFHFNLIFITWVASALTPLIIKFKVHSFLSGSDELILNQLLPSSFFRFTQSFPQLMELISS